MTTPLIILEYKNYLFAFVILFGLVFCLAINKEGKQQEIFGLAIGC